jgi:hypothetical protein
MFFFDSRKIMPSRSRSNFEVLPIGFENLHNATGNA